MVLVINHAYDDSSHDDPGHPERPERATAVRAGIDDLHLGSDLIVVSDRAATREELTRVHDGGYLDELGAYCYEGGGDLDQDTYATFNSWSIATLAAGGGLAVIDELQRRGDGVGFVVTRPPGHHALRDRSMGFCIFGNVALGAAYARAVHGLDRVLVVDWDVHHGNGTQALLQDDPGIRFLSMHQWPFYPGTGAADDRGPHKNVRNVPMAAGLESGQYIGAFERAFDDITEAFAPELVLVSAGFDCLAGDAIGGFTLEMEDVDALTRLVTAYADRVCAGRVVSALEGGYTPTRLAEAVVVHLRALAGLPAAG